MCLIMTICAAVVFSVLYGVNKKNGKARKSVTNTCLMFWAAAIMWSVDGIASVYGGESFFDISREDTVLGFIIVNCLCFRHTTYMAVVRAGFKGLKHSLESAPVSTRPSKVSRYPVPLRARTVWTLCTRQRIPAAL